jgi:hypothetical protein
MRWPLAWAKTADDAKDLAAAVAEELGTYQAVHVIRSRLGTVRFREQELSAKMRRFVPTAWVVAEERADGEVVVAAYYRGEVSEADLNAAREMLKAGVAWDWT